jgi:hypothetical protein
MDKKQKNKIIKEGSKIVRERRNEPTKPLREIIRPRKSPCYELMSESTVKTLMTDLF